MYKRNFSFLLVLVVLTLLQYACSSIRQAVPSPIGLLPLEGYGPAGNGFAADTAYRVFQNEAEFEAAFRAIDTSARRPAFQGQTVVAIVLNTAPETPLHFSRAEVVGKTIHMYAQPCTGCTGSRFILATIPRVGSARSVRFFINGQSKANLELQPPNK